MTIELITAYYREEFLLPLFMLHYNWVDRMTFITEQRSDGKFDDEDKQNWINSAIARSKADWVVLVDMDEFIYPLPWGSNPRVVLEQEPGSLIYSHMTRMWRHHTDADIDRAQPPVPQRLHGAPDHIKPAVFRPLPSTRVGAGNHDIHCDHFLPHGKSWAGAHWANADSCFWIERETRDRGPRLSERNVQRGHGTHTRRTAEQILAECKSHENDPVIIAL
jgi:hypothetical protein